MYEEEKLKERTLEERVRAQARRTNRLRGAWPSLSSVSKLQINAMGRRTYRAAFLPPQRSSYLFLLEDTKCKI